VRFVWKFFSVEKVPWINTECLTPNLTDIIFYCAIVSMCQQTGLIICFLISHKLKNPPFCLPIVSNYSKEGMMMTGSYVIKVSNINGITKGKLVGCRSELIGPIDLRNFYGQT